MIDTYCKGYSENAFVEVSCKNIQQYEACITRLYHTIEKGLSYLEYRPGFGKDNVEKLIVTLSNYANYYDTEIFLSDSNLYIT